MYSSMKKYSLLALAWLEAIPPLTNCVFEGDLLPSPKHSSSYVKKMALGLAALVCRVLICCLFLQSNLGHNFFRLLTL